MGLPDEELTIRVPASLKRRLEAAARASDVTIGALAREALERAERRGRPVASLQGFSEAPDVWRPGWRPADG